MPAAGAPLFQAATANLNPWTEVKVDTDNPDRRPMLLISGELDHTVPFAITNAWYKQHSKTPGHRDRGDEGPGPLIDDRPRLA